MSHDHATFAHGIGPIPDLRQLSQYPNALAVDLRSSRRGVKERDHLILIGRKDVRLNAADFKLIGDRPPLPRDWSEAGIARHIERLIMPEVHADARQAYADALDLTDPADIASMFVEFAQHHPWAADHLLFFDFDAAVQLSAATVKTENSYYVELFADMAKLQIAFTLRLIAEEAGVQLATPFGYAPLDDIDRRGAPSLGPVEKRLLREIALCERALELYWAGRRAPNVEVGQRQSHNDYLVTSSISWLIGRKDVSRPDVQEFSDAGLDVIARSWLAELRRRHGSDLEHVLDSEITRIRRKLRALRSKMQAHVERHGRKTRVGNLDTIRPLSRLMIAARHAVAWTMPTPAKRDGARMRRDVTNVPPPSGARRTIDWLMDKRSAAPAIRPHTLQASLAQEVFTILRYVFVDDDNVLPGSLRQAQGPEAGSHFANSQAQYAQGAGRRPTFDELMAGYYASAQKRVDVTTDVTRLLRGGAKVTSEQRQALANIGRRFRRPFVDA